MADASDYLDLDPADGSHILLITAPYYRHIVDELERGAAATIAEFGATFEKVSVGGAFEMPAAVMLAASRRDGGKYLTVLSRLVVYFVEKQVITI